MPFRPFGLDHLAALAATAAVAFALVRRARRQPAARVPRFGLAAFLAAAAAGWLAFVQAHYGLSAWDVLPLHLCDFLILVAIWALLALRPLACELLYFWSSGTLLAMVTPDLGVGFPHPAFLAFFALHGTVVVAAAVVVFGLGRRPRPGAPWRAFAATLAYAAVVAVVNLAFGTNFLFLCRKPDAPTLLDAFGPWPVYLGTMALFALGLFHLMAWPFREERGSGPGRGGSDQGVTGVGLGRGRPFSAITRRATSGRSLMSPSAPRSMRAAISSEWFTVQGKTRSPRR